MIKPGKAGPLTGAGTGSSIDAEETVDAADRRTVRKALRAGGVTTVVLSIATVLANQLFGGDALTAWVWVLSAVVVGTLVSAGWLVLSIILDLIAGVVPGRRRMLWAGAVFAVAFVSPVLPAAMLQVIAER